MTPFRHQPSLRKAQQLVRLYPQSSVAHAVSAEANLEAGNLDAARASAKKALQLKPSSANAVVLFVRAFTL